MTIAVASPAAETGGALDTLFTGPADADTAKLDPDLVTGR